MNMTIKSRLICLFTAAAALFSCSGCALSGTKLNEKENDIKNKNIEFSDNQSEDKEASTGFDYKKIIEYYTAEINEKELKVFDEVYNGIMSYKEEIEITANVVDKESVGDFLTFLISVCSQFHHLSSDYGLCTNSEDYVTRIDMNYSRSKQQGDEEQLKLNNKIKEITEQAKELSDYEKIKYFHDYIAKNCEYTTEGDNVYSAYGCLVENSAVCEGYSKAFSMLCLESGIPCLNVMGEAVDEKNKQQAHMWNMVKLDGSWYHIDVTWDAPQSVFEDDYIRYDYFNVDDDMIKRDHTPVVSRYMNYPEADDIDNNYFVMQNRLIYNDMNSKQMIETILKDCLMNNEQYVRFRCESEEKYLAVIDELFNEEDNHAGFFELLEKAVDDTQAEVSCEEYQLVKNEKTWVFTIQLKNK